jgi:hypothetical protein
MFFRLFSHLKRNENEMKRKQTKKKRNEKLLEAEHSKNIRSINFALIGSKKFEAKRRKKIKKFCVSMRNGSHFASFHFEAKLFFLAKPAHPRQDPISHHTAMSTRI